MLLFIDVNIDVPDQLDLTQFRATGLQAGEELLPEDQPEGNYVIHNSLEYYCIVVLWGNILHCHTVYVGSENISEVHK